MLRLPMIEEFMLVQWRQHVHDGKLNNVTLYKWFSESTRTGEYGHRSQGMGGGGYREYLPSHFLHCAIDYGELF